MLLNFREKYKTPHKQLLWSNSEKGFLNKVVDLNSAALPIIIMKFFI